MFQITEPDLAELERLLPDIADRLYCPAMTNADRVMIRRVQKIITDVRWNYGPPLEVEIVPAEGDERP